MTTPAWLGRVGVLGLGATGRAVIAALSELGASAIYGYDQRQPEGLGDGSDVELVIGDDARQIEHLREAELDFIVVSPGIPPHNDVYQAAATVLEQRGGGQLASEVELAWQVQQHLGKEARWYAVTGTNGKTTTVSLLGAIFEAAGVSHAVVGNIGTSLIETVVGSDVEALVVEMSSFQLHNTYSVNPDASICLNIDADHLDWHGDEMAYAADKARVYENTRYACLYDEAAARVIAMIMQADVIEGCRAIGLNPAAPRISELGVVEGLIVDRAFIKERQNEALALAELADMAGYAGDKPSRALLIDTLAAVAMARVHGVSPEDIQKGLRSFHLAAHRRSVIGEVADLTWIDDSKATNAHAAAASLESEPPSSVVWVAGGDAKGQDLGYLVRSVAAKLRGVVVIGADPEPLVAALEKYAPQVPKQVVDGHEDFMFSVVNEAVALSRPGDTVILAPACASWDQFRNYHERAEAFRDAVDRLRQAWDGDGQEVSS